MGGLFEKGDYKGALVNYMTAIGMVSHKQWIQTPAQSRQISKWWSNAAACYMGLKLFAKVTETTDKALALDPSNLKALFRKASACFQLGLAAGDSDKGKEKRKFLEQSLAV